jgi:hypothetical protein
MKINDYGTYLFLPVATHRHDSSFAIISLRPPVGHKACCVLLDNCMVSWDKHNVDVLLFISKPTF